MNHPERHAELAEASLPLSGMLTGAEEMLRQAQHDVLLQLVATS